MSPIRTRESNFLYRGGEDVSDLPGHLSSEGQFYSVWELTEQERQMLLAGGRIRVGVFSQPIPPMAFGVVPNEGQFERVACGCTVCGQEPDAAIHLSGPECHPYKVTRVK